VPSMASLKSGMPVLSFDHHGTPIPAVGVKGQNQRCVGVCKRELQLRRKCPPTLTGKQTSTVSPAMSGNGPKGDIGPVIRDVGQ